MQYQEEQRNLPNAGHRNPKSLLKKNLRPESKDCLQKHSSSGESSEETSARGDHLGSATSDWSTGSGWGSVATTWGSWGNSAVAGAVAAANSAVTADHLEARAGDAGLVRKVEGDGAVSEEAAWALDLSDKY